MSALTASKEEVRRLETELAKMKQNSEAAIVTLQGQYSVTVKTLERRVGGGSEEGRWRRWVVRREGGGWGGGG